MRLSRKGKNVFFGGYEIIITVLGLLAIAIGYVSYRRGYAKGREEGVVYGRYMERNPEIEKELEKLD